MNVNKSKPTIFIIFGGTGDLNSRKLAPALYNLYLDGWLPNNFSIVGTGRTKYNDDEYRHGLLDDINQFSRSGKADLEKWEAFSAHIFYQVSDLTKIETYQQLGERIKNHQDEWQAAATVIFYLAVSPNFFKVIAE